jgi:hypothetical protein
MVCNFRQVLGLYHPPFLALCLEFQLFIVGTTMLNVRNEQEGKELKAVLFEVLTKRSKREIFALLGCYAA